MVGGEPGRRAGIGVKKVAEAVGPGVTVIEAGAEAAGDEQREAGRERQEGQRSSPAEANHIQLQAEHLDAEMLRQVEAFDPLGVLETEEQGKGFACGRNAIAAVLWAAQDLGATQVKVLKHATSGDVTGDYSGVVGYAAAVITRQVEDISNQ